MGGSRVGLQLGFRIQDVLELQGWKVLTLDETVPFACQRQCPADAVPLRTACTLVGLEGRQRVRIGCCEACGYAGYVDRPTEAWMREFYRSVWDDAQARSVAELVERHRGVPAKSRDGSEHPMVTVTKRLGLDPDRYICEVGCGFGVTLEQLAQLGYRRLVGIEASRHRAEVARKAYGLEVLTPGLESHEVQRELGPKAPFGLIFAFQVLEHVYDPAAMISAASGLQNGGDYLVLSVPNSAGEPVMGILGFLPHLHSFRLESLRRLAGRYQYVLRDESLTDETILNVVFERTDAPAIAHTNGDACFETTVTKCVRGLGLDRSYQWARRRFWWLKGADRGGHARLFTNPRLERAHWAAVSWWKGLVRPRSLVVRELERRHTSPDESPVEIQFDGPVRLFYK